MNRARRRGSLRERGSAIPRNEHSSASVVTSWQGFGATGGAKCKENSSPCGLDNTSNQKRAKVVNGRSDTTRDMRDFFVTGDERPREDNCATLRLSTMFYERAKIINHLWVIAWR
jgi:hypothetical protein